MRLTVLTGSETVVSMVSGATVLSESFSVSVLLCSERLFDCRSLYDFAFGSAGWDCIPIEASTSRCVLSIISCRDRLASDWVSKNFWWVSAVCL